MKSVHIRLTEVSFFLLFFLFAVVLRAQGSEVKGRVTGYTGSPLENAKVTVVETGVSALTQKDGFFSIAVPSGLDFRLEVDPSSAYATYAALGKTVPMDTLLHRKEVFYLSAASMSTRKSVGTLFLGSKKGVPGLEDFEGMSKYQASKDAAYRQQKIGEYDMVTQQPIKSESGHGSEGKSLSQLVRESYESSDSGVIDMSDKDIPNNMMTVALGYGKEPLTRSVGSIGSITSRDFNQGINVSAETLFQGKLAGVQVSSQSGEPGAPIDLRILGVTSLAATNQPLIVVDGIPLEGDLYGRSHSPSQSGLGNSFGRNPLNFLNPADIQQVTVLKDPTSAAIYGSRAANGVVLISTKEGRYQSPMKVTLNLEGSLSVASKKLPILGASEYKSKLGEKLNASRALEGLPLLSQGYVDTGYLFGGNVDWQDRILRTAATYNTQVGLEGGSKTSAYRVAFGYLKNQGVVKGTGLGRFTTNAHIAQKLWKNQVEVGAVLNYTLLNDDYVPSGSNASYEGNLIGAALQANPTQPVLEEERTNYIHTNPSSLPSLGRQYNQDSNRLRNPLAMLDYIKDYSKTNKLFLNAYLRVNIAPWLSYKGSIGIDYSNSMRQASYDYFLDVPGVRRTYTSRTAKASKDDANVIDPGGYGYQSNRTHESYLTEHTLNFNKTFNNSFGLDAVLGFAYQTFSNNYNVSSGSGFLSRQAPFYRQLQFATTTSALSESNSSALSSLFARVNLSYKDRYLLTASLRADNNDKFSPRNATALFPAFGLAWRISEESFAPNFFNDLKLRAGFAITGNQGISPSFLSRLSPPPLPGSGGFVANPDLKMETTTGFNVGLDFALAKNRIYGSIDYFNKTTTDVLVLRVVDTTSPLYVAGFSQFAGTNSGLQINNSGVQIAVNALVIDKALKFTIGANASYIRNVVQGTSDVVDEAGHIESNGVLSFPYSLISLDGFSVNSFGVHRFAGTHDSKEYPLYDSANATTSNPANADKKIMGKSNPSWLFGLNLMFEYKRFDLALLFSGMAGQSVYNNTASVLSESNLVGQKNALSSSVSPSSSNIFAPRAVSSQFVENASFLRLSNLVLGYNFALQSKKIKSLRLYFAAQNLFVITSYTGYDPEVNSVNYVNGVASSGIDYFSMPRPINFTLGANIVF